jgi:hydrogenase maturation protease
MPDLRAQLEQCLQGRVCLMGLGNVDYGDDGFGVRLVEALARSERRELGGESLSSGDSNATFSKPTAGNNGVSDLGLPLCLINAGTTPERFTGRVADGGFDHIIFLDAVEFGGAPGSVVLLNSDEMAARYPQISTHKISLGLLAKWAEANGTTQAWLLGVQPELLKSGEGLTPRVQSTLELLLELVRDITLEVMA